MAARHRYTTVEVARMVTAGDDDPEFLFDGSDDDFDGDLQEEGYDPLDREQGKCTLIL